MSAATRIDELKKRYDENPRRFFAPLANEYRKSGDLEMAITLCQQHLADQPGNMNGQVVYGQALYEAGRFDEAKATFETALTLDPENLIALRHLGDIARTSGDGPKAREWYIRVLDADPRNDEIIAFIAEIDVASPAVPAAPSSPAAEPLGEAVTQIIEAHPRSSFARPLTPAPASAMSAHQVEGFTTGASVRGSAATPPVAQATVAPAGTAPVVAPPAEGPRGTPPRPSLSLLDISIDLSATAEETPAPASPPDPASAAEIDAAFGDFNFGETHEADPPSALALDVTAPPADAGALEFDDINLSMPSSEAAPPEQLSPAQPVESSDPILGYTPAFGTAIVSPDVETPRPFVTETMAELYLQQGFRDEALAVYKQLSEENPLDASLKERVHALETGGRSSLSLDRVSQEVPMEPEPLGIEALAPPAAAPLSRNAREYFSTIAARRAVKNEGTPGGTPHQGTARQGTAPQGVATVAAPAAPTADAAALLSFDGVAAPNVASGGTVDTLFKGTEIAVSDEHLALAFARVGQAVDPAAGVKGRPTQQAQSELSLDHVFRDSSPRAKQDVVRQSEKLRFDQFFAGGGSEPAQEQADTVPPASGAPGTPAELEQFQDWLTQLKKP